MMHSPVTRVVPDVGVSGDCPRAEGSRHDAQARLIRSGYLPLRQISCEVRERALLLRGSVPSYYLKQMAQSIVADVEGIEQVCNFIEVRARTGSSALVSDAT